MSNEKNKQLSKKVQKVIKFVIITTVLVIVSNIAIDNPYTHRLIKGYIKKTFAKNDKIGVDFNGLSVSLVPPGVEATL